MGDQLGRLFETLGEKLREGLVGEPVHARIILESTTDYTMLIPQLASLIHGISLWFSGPIIRCFALGSPYRGLVSLQLSYAGGQTALLTTQIVPAQRATDLKRAGKAIAAIVGHHGTLQASLTQLPVTSELPIRVDASKLQELQGLVTRTILSGQAIKPEE